MNTTFILLWMVFMHIVDDYYLQGILASMKQKSWWGNTDSLFKNDYMWALLMHAFSWTFMIMLPIAFVYGFKISLLFLIMFSLNWSIHAIVDNLKANEKKINLWHDQLIHLAQIIITAWVLIG